MNNAGWTPSAGMIATRHAVSGVISIKTKIAIGIKFYGALAGIEPSQ
jgi:hypothetical protein